MTGVLPGARLSPLGAPGASPRPFREVADLLAGRLSREGVPCGRHPAGRPRDDCPQCADEAALRVYRAACDQADGVTP